MKRILTVLLAVLLLWTSLGGAGAVNGNSAASVASYQLMITTPSEGNLPMPLQRDFYVGGNIISEAPVPEDAQITVKLFDAAGNEVRRVASVSKGGDCLWVFHEKLYYSQKDDPERVFAKKELAPEFVAADMTHPMDSFNDASIKCTFSDTAFRAMIVYATDREHGLLQDREVAFVNHDGSVIEGLPEGDYKVTAVLTDGTGNVLAEAEKAIRLANPERCILGRFHPDENYANLMKMRQELNLAGDIDWIPGFVPTANGDTNGFRSMFANNDLALYANSKTYALIYYIEPASSSYRLELAFLQYAQRVGSGDTFRAYHYDIGEPVLRFKEDTTESMEGKLVPFEAGDYMDLCRLDIVDENTCEGVYALDGRFNQKAYTDLSDTIDVEYGDTFAISGVLCPFQVAPEDTVKTAEGLHTVNNNYAVLLYTFDNDTESFKMAKPCTVSRYTSTLTAQAAICLYEFYNVFHTSGYLKAGDTYKVTIDAYDCHMDKVEGASESFSIRVK